MHKSALKAGATTVTDLSTSAWGDRGSRIQTHVEDVSEEAMAKRMIEQKYIDDMRESAETLDRELREIGTAR